MSSEAPTPGAVITLPREVTQRLLADVDAIAKRMTRQIAELGGLPPEFRRVGYLRTVLAACRDALRTLVRLLEDGHGLRPGDLDHLGLMGARQAELGVPLELLLAAYRHAAKVVWREVIGEATRLHDLPPAMVIAVTENVLEYLDAISGAVGAAYLETRERIVRERDRNRDRVLARLLAGDDSMELRHLAAVSDLELSPPYRVVAYSIPGADLEMSELDDVWRRAGALTAAEPPHTWIVLLPARTDIAVICREALRRAGPAGAEMRFGVGPVALGLGDLAASAMRARRALDIGWRIEPERRVHDDADLGVFAALDSDPEALAVFASRVLGPLAESAQPRHAELRHTLEALLLSHNISEAAATLGLHRHTIVYRIRRLKELGVDPDAPGERPRLWLALQALRLLHPPGDPLGEI